MAIDIAKFFSAWNRCQSRCSTNSLTHFLTAATVVVSSNMVVTNDREILSKKKNASDCYIEAIASTLPPCTSLVKLGAVGCFGNNITYRIGGGKGMRHVEAAGRRAGLPSDLLPDASPRITINSVVRPERGVCRFFHTGLVSWLNNEDFALVFHLSGSRVHRPLLARHRLRKRNKKSCSSQSRAGSQANRSPQRKKLAVRDVEPR